MMKKYISYVLILVVGFVIGILCRPHRIERVVDIQRDTTFLIDTHIIEKPVLVEKHAKETLLVAVHDTTIINDTIFVPIPIEKKIYKGEDYYAEISGYKASLDRIEVYPKTTTIKETITQSVTNRNALGIGLEVNYLGSPYIPIYLEYSNMLHQNAEMYARIFYDTPSQSYGFGMGAKISIGW